jgi:putative endonuclease
MKDNQEHVPAPPTWYLYMLRCGDTSLYTGITTDVNRRLKEHQDGSPKGAKSLRGKGPLTLVFCEEMSDQSMALKAEYKIKQLSKTCKEHLVAGQTSIQNVLYNL